MGQRGRLVFGVLALSMCFATPAFAKKAKDGLFDVESRALIACIVTVDGLLRDCIVKYETPPGRGVGDAALRLSRQFKMRPASGNGTPVEAPVQIPLYFPVPGAPPRTQAEKDQGYLGLLIGAHECDTARGVAGTMSEDLQRQAADCR